MNWSSSSNPKDIIRRYRICPEQKIGRFKCFGEDNQRFIWPINNKDYRLVPSQYMRVDGDAVYTLKNIWSTAITDKPLPKSGRFYFEMESIGGNNVNFIGLVKKTSIDLTKHFAGQIPDTIAYHSSNRNIYNAGSSYETEYHTYVIIENFSKHNKYSFQ